MKTIRDIDVLATEANCDASSEPYHYTSELSTLRLGGFPLELPTTLGNKLVLRPYETERNGDGEVCVAKYRQDLGCITLTLFND